MECCGTECREHLNNRLLSLQHPMAQWLWNAGFPPLHHSTTPFLRHNYMGRFGARE
jgi:hypothetical protein